MAIELPEKPAELETPKARSYKVIGTRPVRPDGADKVTGRAVYGADIRLTGTLRGRVLRSPHSHARILGIDTSKAEALPGVKAVVTGRDWPALADKFEDTGEDVVNLSDLGHNLLAVDKVLYRGHAVAAVAAIDDPTAQKALSLIEVKYEPLPAVFDVRQSMKPDAPLLSNKRFTDEMGKKADKPSNIGRHARFEVGNLDQGFAQADVVLEHEYRTQMVHQGYIEPHTATAYWNMDGNLTVWTSTQGAFGVRDTLVDLLKQPLGKIKVVPLEIGGGFGGKLGIYLEPVAALLSRKTGKPVQLTMSRTEVFEASGPAPGTSIKVKVGATKDGKITAWQADLAYEDGAFSGLGAGNACLCMVGPYELPNALLNGFDAVVNKPKTAAYRAPNAPQAAFAAESILDELAEKLGIDPLELRRRNAAREGTRQISGQQFKRIGFVETLEAALNSEHYRSPLGTPPAGKKRGRGVASGFWHNGGFKSAAYAQINADGSVSLVEGSVDIGGTRASIAMQLAETLGIPFEKMRVQVADTDSVGYNSNTGGSRTTFASGWAAYEVGMDLRRQLIEKAAQILDLPADDLLYEDGTVHSIKNPDQKLTFDQLAAKIAATGNLIVGRASVSPTTQGPAFATHVVDVEVDEATGKADVLRYTCVQDVGTAVHPAYVEGQIQGGAVQGIGWALNEEYVWDNGVMRNSSFLDYRMPTSLDVPMIDTVLVEVPNPGHPYGVRGVGEVPLVPPMAAVANAMHNALGVRFRQLPMSPRRVLEETGVIGG
ncbi:MAG: xanthine dehydrogenase family protein molybdopterin-binding subunit [Chloroflexi bacterium]|nr:xanthine dehydrogenase family protein molybdopterin-binding subunit [Chloroflexota bacterium]